jgi:hypothetical protein
MTSKISFYLIVTLTALEALGNIPKRKPVDTHQQAAVQSFNTDSTIIPLKNDALTIRGKIMDKDGEPLNGAEVSWNGQLITQTNATGDFEFVLPALKPGIVSLSYADLNPVVRNYHPSMGNVGYTIHLCRPVKCRIGPPDSIYFETTAIRFTTKNIELTDDHRSVLTTLAEKVKNYPAIQIELTTGAVSHPEIRRAKYMLSIVRNWLVDSEGISEDRIRINTNLDHPELLKVVTVGMVNEER